MYIFRVKRQPRTSVGADRERQTERGPSIVFNKVIMLPCPILIYITDHFGSLDLKKIKDMNIEG